MPSNGLVKLSSAAIVASLLLGVLGSARAQSLNTSVWKFMTDGPRNGEQEHYVPGQCALDAEGEAVLQAAYVNGGWDSCEIESNGLTAPTGTGYTTIEAVLKIPNAPGSWPAFWALGPLCNPFGTDSCPWPSPGAQEYDFAEFLSGSTTSVNEEIHTCGGSSSCSSPTDNAGGQVGMPNGGNASTAFHDYKIEWYVGKLVFFVDGVQTQTISDSSILADGIILLFNEACGGSGASGTCTASNPPGPYIVKSITVTDQNGNVAINGFTSGSTSAGTVSAPGNVKVTVQ